MVDLILLAAILAAAYRGFKVGNKFATLREVWTAIKARF